MHPPNHEKAPRGRQTADGAQDAADTSYFTQLDSFQQTDRDALLEAEIAKASLTMVISNTREGRKLAWRRMRSLIFMRSTRQVLRLERELGLADTKAESHVIRSRTAHGSEKCQLA